MLVGQNIPQGTTPEKRAEIIAKRVEKLLKLVDNNPTVKESVHRAASIARQIAIQREVETNAQFKNAIGDFLQHMDD
jgi:hypothetical protein